MLNGTFFNRLNNVLLMVGVRVFLVLNLKESLFLAFHHIYCRGVFCYFLFKIKEISFYPWFTESF